MYIDIHNHARDDLKRLRATHPEAVAAVLVVLEQLNADPRAIDKLTTRGNNSAGVSSLNVKRWERARDVGNLWRFRVLDTPATSYRVVYGYQWQTRQLCVLGVIHKELFDYDDLTSDFSKRVLADWRAL